MFLDSNIAKMTILLKIIYRFSAIPIKLSMAPLHKIRRKNSTVYMETQKTSNIQRKLEKEKPELEEPASPNSDCPVKATATKTVWCWQKDKNADQWHRTGSPEGNLWSMT